jgi:aminoglycoside phosphotransferase
MNLLRKIPAGLQLWLQDATIEENREGMTATSVFRLERPDEPDRYLKIAARGSEDDLRDEVSRLLWLQGRLPVPEVIYWAEDAERQYLLISAIPGVVLYDEAVRDQLPAVIQVYAEGLRQIHAVQACPFDVRLDVKIAHAARRLHTNQIDESDFDDERQGRTAQSAFRELLDTRPTNEDLVFTHGDYCTPNVLMDPGSFALGGFIDWGRAGIADRYQDLALAARSIEYNFGLAWVEPFFQAYGIPYPDAAKVKFYRLLDEFF